jgi:hypothetical protein
LTTSNGCLGKLEDKLPTSNGCLGKLEDKLTTANDIFISHFEDVLTISNGCLGKLEEKLTTANVIFDTEVDSTSLDIFSTDPCNKIFYCNNCNIFRNIYLLLSGTLTF